MELSDKVVLKFRRSDLIRQHDDLGDESGTAGSIFFRDYRIIFRRSGNRGVGRALVQGSSQNSDESPISNAETRV